MILIPICNTAKVSYFYCVKVFFFVSLPLPFSPNLVREELTSDKLVPVGIVFKAKTINQIYRSRLASAQSTTGLYKLLS